MGGIALEPKPNNANPGKLVNALLAAAGQTYLFGFTVYSSKLAAQFVLLFDANAIPANGAVPLFALPVSSSNFVSTSYSDTPRSMEAGIVVCNSSTDTSLTLGSADCFIDVQWC